MQRHFFLPMASRLVLAALLAALPSLVGAGAAWVAACGYGPAALQDWQLGVPQTGFLYNSASHQCLNVAGCRTDVIFDGCSTAPKQTCGGAGLHGQPNEEFTRNGSRLISALPGSRCLTVDGTGEVKLAACDPANPPTQSWTLASSGELKTGDGRCMTASAAGPTPPPAPAPPPGSCHISMVRQLSTIPCVQGSTYDCSSTVRANPPPPQSFPTAT